MSVLMSVKYVYLKLVVLTVAVAYPLEALATNQTSGAIAEHTLAQCLAVSSKG